MSVTDHNGFRIKPGHHGCKGLPFGEPVWLLRRTDDKLYGVWNSRHDAIGARKTGFSSLKPEWLEPVQVPVGSVRMTDVIFVNGGSNE
jgi:hypothetical protein